MRSTGAARSGTGAVGSPAGPQHEDRDDGEEDGQLEPPDEERRRVAHVRSSRRRDSVPNPSNLAPSAARPGVVTGQLDRAPDLFGILDEG